MRVFELLIDYEYDFKGEREMIPTGTTFYGGVQCSWPALRQYATTWGEKRYWFDPDFVEASKDVFRELFT